MTNILLFRKNWVVKTTAAAADRQDHSCMEQISLLASQLTSKHHRYGLSAKKRHYLGIFPKMGEGFNPIPKTLKHPKINFKTP